MSRIHVVKRNDDDSPPRIVGWFDSEDAQVFTEAMPPQTETSWGFGSRTEVSRAPEKLLRTAEGRWVMALEFGPPLGTEYRFVAEGEASAWLSANGYGRLRWTWSTTCPNGAPAVRRSAVGSRSGWEVCCTAWTSSRDARGSTGPKLFGGWWGKLCNEWTASFAAELVPQADPSAGGGVPD